MMHRLLYRLLVILLSPIIFGHISWLSFKNRNRRYFWQRLGFEYAAFPRNSLWFHCASVGEVNTLLPLLKNLHEQISHEKFIITTNTITGAKIVAQQNLNYLHHSFLPFDWVYSIKCFLFSAQPKALYVMETEIWPNLFHVCRQQSIPVQMLNARLSTRTTSANRWIKALLKISLSDVSAIHARSQKDADAYKDLGADKDIIFTTGNLKFCTATSASRSSAATKKDTIDFKNREYVLLASTHHDEEKQIYAVWKTLGREELLVIAPRHPERNASIIKQLACDNLASRSKNQMITAHTEVFLLDTVGELKDLFAAARLVIMGGSFVGVGGHNILEPAGYNKAIITGPYMENFSAELALMKNHEAIVQIGLPTNPYRGLSEELSRLLNNRTLRSQLENNTRKISHDVEKILDDYTAVITRESR